MSNNTKKVGPKQYSNKPRKPQSLIGKIAKHGDTAVNVMSGMIIGGGAYGLNLALTAKSKAEKAAKARFDKYVAELDKKRVSKGGGGGGGIYNPAQPLADKNLMNKFGKKLK